MSHPKQCKKYCQFGTNRKRGCVQGKDCARFHPYLCRFSVTNHRCTKEDCNFTHLKGTKRHAETPEERAAAEKRSVKRGQLQQQTTSQQVTRSSSGNCTAPPAAAEQPPPPSSSKTSTHSSQSFLDISKMLQEMATSFEKRFQEMEKRLPPVPLIQQPPTWTPFNYPSMMPPQSRMQGAPQQYCY